MKRIFLLIATNLAVMLVLSVVVSVLGLDQWLNAEGIDYYSLMVFSAVFGFGGIAAGAAGVAKILFIIFLIVSIVTFLMSLARK